jgi:beta-N-acetylhexosaminidase
MRNTLDRQCGSVQSHEEVLGQGTSDESQGVRVGHDSGGAGGHGAPRFVSRNSAGRTVISVKVASTRACTLKSFAVPKRGAYRHSIVGPRYSTARWTRWQPRLRLALWALTLTATAALAFAPAHAIARSGSLGIQTVRVESLASAPGAYTAKDPATWTDRQLAAQLTFCAVSAASPRAAIRYSRMGIGGFVILGNGARRSIGRDLSVVSRAAPHRIRPFVASDEEGGQVQRLWNVIYRLPSARLMGQWSIAKTRSVAKDYGARLRKLGVSVVFGPVADLDVPGHFMSSLDRCFSSSPRTVGLHVVAWSSGLRSVGVIPTVKHWPGHGHASNTHSGAAIAPALSVLRKRDMLPFERAFEAGVPMVMVGHLQSSGLTEARTPASLSPKAMRYLRSRAGPDTVIVTDSLSMAATTRALGIGSSAAAVRALEAGADFALVCSARPEKVISAVESAIRSGRLPRRQAEASVRRILRLKAQSDLAPRGAGRLLARAAHGVQAGRETAPLCWRGPTRRSTRLASLTGSLQAPDAAQETAAFAVRWRVTA